MCKFLCPKSLLLILLAGACAVNASASLNLYFNIGSGNQIGITLANDDEYTIVTSGTDPYVSTMGLSRPLDKDETVLTFEYVSTADVDMLQLFFGPAYSEARSKRCGTVPVSAGWKTYSVNISDEIKNFSWGAASSVLRMDFGTKPGVGIILRHLRITSATSDPGWSSDNANPDLASTISLGLPVLDIATVDAEEPTCDRVSAPEGSIGAGITNATKVPGYVRRYEPDGLLSYDSGDYMDGESGMTLKIRGNTSAWQLRKPYKIKLQKKADLLCRGDKKYNDKNWVLLNDYDMMLRNGMWVNELVGLDWTPQCQYVNVRMNGEYRGVYLLCEAVERNTDCRINVSKTGFIVELDAYWWNEGGAYVPSTLAPVWNYTFKYPDFEDMDNAAKSYVADVMMRYELSPSKGDYDELIDCESFAAWLIGHDILGTLDYGGSNMYFSKYDDTPSSKIRRPTMWDFDSSEQTKDAWCNSHLYYYDKLFGSTNNAFVRAYARYWQNTGSTVCDRMVERLTRFQESPEAAAYDASMALTNLHWGIAGKMSQQCTGRSVKWYTERQRWLKNAMLSYDHFLESGIDDIGTGSDAGIVVQGRKVFASNGGPFVVLNMAGCRVAVSNGEPVEIAGPGFYIVVVSGGCKKIVLK